MNSIIAIDTMSFIQSPFALTVKPAERRWGPPLGPVLAVHSTRRIREPDPGSVGPSPLVATSCVLGPRHQLEVIWPLAERDLHR
jgi:hypothetical protein